MQHMSHMFGIRIRNVNPDGMSDRFQSHNNYFQSSFYLHIWKDLPADRPFVNYELQYQVSTKDI